MTDDNGVQPNAGTALGATPANGAEPTLDSLIKEFEAGKDAPVAKVLRAIQPVVDKVARDNVREAADRSDKAMQSLVTDIRKAVGDESLDEDLAIGYVRQYGFKNPEVEKAWNEQDQAPEAWKTAAAKVVEAAKGKFKPSSTLRTDTLAARAAVAGQTPASPAPFQFDAAKVSGMSDRDYAQWKKEAAQAQRSK